MKILKIGADWCMSCLVMRPRLAQIEKEYPDLVTEYYDFDKDKGIVNKYGVTSGLLPAFIFLDKQGREILRKSGEPSKKELVEAILAHKDK